MFYSEAYQAYLIPITQMTIFELLKMHINVAVKEMQDHFLLEKCMVLNPSTGVKLNYFIIFARADSNLQAV